MEQVKLRSLWLIPLCLLIAFGPWDSVSLLESMLPWALFGYGVELPARAIATWRPDRIVCARCGYRRHAEAESLRCPECGSDWRRPTGARMEHRIESPRYLVAAAASTFLAFLLFAQFAYNGSPWLRRIQPINGIIRAATSPSLMGGLATEEDLRRYRAESFRPRLIHPARVGRGETIPIRVEGRHLESFLPHMHGVTVHIGGAWFEGEDPPPPPPAGAATGRSTSTRAK